MEKLLRYSNKIFISKKIKDYKKIFNFNRLPASFNFRNQLFFKQKKIKNFEFDYIQKLW